MIEDPFTAFFNENSGEITGKVVSVDNKKVILSLTDDLSGSIRENDFDGKLPAIGDEVKCYIANQERKSYMVNLTLNKRDVTDSQVNEDKKSRVAPAPTKATFGDLIKDKITK